MGLDQIKIEEGKPLPLGAMLTGDGVNFSIFSRHAESVTLVLFESPGRDSPYKEIALDSRKNHTGDIWHCHVRGAGAGTQYLYRADGPYIPNEGLRFNKNKPLFDPYARALTDLSGWNMESALGYDNKGPYQDMSFSFEDSLRDTPRCIVVNDSFDWQGDLPLNYPLRFSVLYETHVRGLTANPNSGVAHPGTYRGVIEKIPYLKDLGITSLELLPIQEFNERELIGINPRTGEPLENYWGYSTLAFFAPKSSYAADRTPGGQVNEFKEMVRELHKAGIEVILDIVFNHTAEGNERGPTVCFRGLDNTIYYMLADDKRYYKNYSGCGNTVNCNHPVVRSFILDCLRYWVVDLHIDGFRFDLGSILGRDQAGRLMENPPILERIAEDPVLRNTKIIAEAWDAGGAYQVGWFPGGRWAEWNDRFRDDVRKFWRGDGKQASCLATRLSGSSDLYLRDGRKPFHSVNYVTSHDGFTIKDMVSYNNKHNDENGEENRDGSDHNYSFNCGIEGPSTNAAIERVRRRQIKNFFATLLFSQGTPMILGGDEIARTQSGNNNAYCHNDKISWYDWSLLQKNCDLFRFVKELVAFRLRHPAFMRPEFYTGKDGNYNSIPDISWFDENGKAPEWDKVDSLLALRLDGSRTEVYSDRDDNDFFIMFNASRKECIFKVKPPLEGKKWFCVMDTSLESPHDVVSEAEAKLLVSQDEYRVKDRSMVMLLSKIK